MKQTLLSVNLKGIRGVHAVMLLAFLSLFMSFGASAQTGATAAFPIAYYGKWSTLPSAPNSTVPGWSQTGLSGDPFNTNLGSSTAPNATSTGVANFTNAGAVLQVDFATSADKLSFLYNTKNTGTFNGEFIVEESSTINGVYTTVGTPIVSITGGTYSSSSQSVTLPLKPGTRSVRFRLKSITGSNPVYVDRINISPNLNATTIDSFTPGSGSVGDEVVVTGKNIPEISALVFFNSAGEMLGADDVVVNPDPTKPTGTVISGKVPVDAVTGKIGIIDENYEIIALSSSDFYIAPDITSISPKIGAVGDKIKVFGTNLTNINFIRINGFNAIHKVIDGVLTATVPADANPGVGSLIISTLGGIDSETFTVDNNPLPVELVNFNATPTSLGAKLSWQTASEENNAYFEVQSTNNLKSGDFQTLGRVETQNSNSNTLLSYDFLDTKTAKGTTVYYRLKQVDTDGTFEYSKVVSVNIKQGAKGQGLVNVFPNPFKQQVNIEVEAEKAGALVATLYDATGQKVFAKSISVEAGVNAKTLDLPSNLRSGLYFLTTQVDGTTKTTRLIKE
ncbi:T9SS type A sorting domain-containing protein [Nibribacter ruber]|uniref:T9SS type A sorting domain-containing protein n=1 Tax=Nibribacter ruber TaxID=2698458 RepID=A0A6P1P091_9BACT|nr:T9SS type A sorting domain-containing protein [Nibribacter ruber]QHL88049.1 T9SS type A sorting domain-containing protein [Nibribacter ruber]